MNDKRDGLYMYYWRNGRIREKAVYRNGRLVGKFVMYDEAGRETQTFLPTDMSDEQENEDDKSVQGKMVDDLLKNLSNYEKL